MNTKSNAPKRNWIYSLFAFIIFLVFVGVIYSNINSDTEEDRMMDAWVCAENVVRQNLKSPSSAKFCTYPEAIIKDKGNNEYMVTGWVDADNSFGASIRTDFTVTLTLTEKGYKNANCYFDDDSIYAIAEDIVEEKGLGNKEDDAMKEYISDWIDEEYADRETESEEIESYETEITSEESTQQTVNQTRYVLSSPVVGADLMEYLNYLDMTYEEIGLNINQSSNTLHTRYPLEKAVFVGNKCFIFLWFAEVDNDSKPDSIEIKSPATAFSLDELKEFLETELGNQIYDENNYGFSIDIPETDFIIKVSYVTTDKSIFISKK